MVHGVYTFRPYVFGSAFKIITDHQPLLWFKPAELNTRVQKWRFKLSEYNYTVVYKPGRQNANANALSRNPVESIPINFISRAKRANHKIKRHDIANAKPKRGRPAKNLKVKQPLDPNRYPKRQLNKPYAESKMSGETEVEGCASNPGENTPQRDKTPEPITDETDADVASEKSDESDLGATPSSENLPLREKDQVRCDGETASSLSSKGSSRDS